MGKTPICIYADKRDFGSKGKETNNLGPVRNRSFECPRSDKNLTRCVCRSGQPSWLHGSCHYKYMFLCSRQGRYYFEKFSLCDLGRPFQTSPNEDAIRVLLSFFPSE